MATLDVNVEVSARHVHLSQEDIEKLFGAGYELKVKKEIAGGFVAEERLTITGPRDPWRELQFWDRLEKVLRLSWLLQTLVPWA